MTEERKTKTNARENTKVSDTKLIRQELPIQCVVERNEDCTATVPVHLEIMKLPPLIRTDSSLLNSADTNVRQAYNEDMRYYLKALKQDGRYLPWLRGYEEFKSEWRLEGVADRNGFLALNWIEGDEVHRIRFNEVPVVLYNQYDENRKFYTPSYTLNNEWVESFTRCLTDPETVYMSLEKMRHYGVENALTQIHEERGIAKVTAYAFCSDYLPNMAKALLLRDFAVFYLNQVLQKVEYALD